MTITGAVASPATGHRVPVSPKAGQPRRPRLVVAVGLAGALLAAASPVEAYRFYEGVVLAAEAVRWAPEDLPLRFHLQDNIPEFLDEAEWRSLVRRAFAQWNGVRTAEINLILEPGLVAPAASEDGTDMDDGMLTIGWLPEEDVEDEEGPITLAYARLGWYVGPRTMASCDIVIGDAFRRRIDADQPRDAVMERLHQSLLHEIGHCLGLDHTEPHPVPRFVFTEEVEEAAGAPASRFGPDTVMSYAGLRLPELTEDDVTGISLLYPARGYLERRGAVSGAAAGRFRTGQLFVRAGRLSGFPPADGTGCVRERRRRLPAGGTRPRPGAPLGASDLGPGRRRA